MTEAIRQVACFLMGVGVGGLVVWWIAMHTPTRVKPQQQASDMALALDKKPKPKSRLAALALAEKLERQFPYVGTEEEYKLIVLALRAYAEMD